MSTLKVEPYTYKKTKVSKQGEIYEETVNEVLVSADMTWTWVNNNKPEERINVDWVLVGQQADASQALGSALTYTNRYFLLKFFNIATPDNDPDNFRGKQREAEAAEDRAIADEIINTFDEELKEFLESHKGNGFCPCALEKSPDTKCMCKEFREMETGVCICGLYIKEDI